MALTSPRERNLKENCDCTPCNLHKFVIRWPPHRRCLTQEASRSPQPRYADSYKRSGQRRVKSTWTHNYEAEQESNVPTNDHGL